MTTHHDTRPAFRQFTAQLAEELDRADHLHGDKWPSTTRDQWTLLVGTEFGELLKALAQSSNDDIYRLQAQVEALHVSAMAFKLWESLGGVRGDRDVA